MTLDPHTATNLTLLAALYFATGQALAHPIVVKVSETKKLSRDTRMRMGIVFGVAWPLLVIRLVSLVAAKVAKSESGGLGGKGLGGKGVGGTGVGGTGAGAKGAANERVANERATNERVAHEHVANEHAVADGDDPGRRDEP